MGLDRALSFGATVAGGLATCGHRLRCMVRGRLAHVVDVGLPRAEAELRHRSSSPEPRADIERGHLLLDEVIGTLTVLARPGLVPPDELHRQCAALVGRLEGVGGQDEVRWLAREVAVWLGRLLAAGTSLSDPTVVARSEELARVARDALNVPGVIDPALAHRLESVRRGGTPVEFDAMTGPGLGHEEVLRVLDRLLDHADQVDRIVVRLPDREHAGAEVSWVALRRPGLDAEQRAVLERAVGDQLGDVEDDQVVCTLRWQTWPDPPGSPGRARGRPLG